MNGVRSEGIRRKLMAKTRAFRGLEMSGVHGSDRNVDDMNTPSLQVNCAGESSSRNQRGFRALK